MFPRPIEKSGPVAKTAYQAFLPVALFLWLLPLLAIFVTSIRGAADINSGNIFGWPSEFALIENYTAVFTQSAAAQYMLNSVLITVPSVAISVTLACVGGYAGLHDMSGNLREWTNDPQYQPCLACLPRRLRAGDLPLPGRRAALLPLRRRQLHPVPDPHGPGPRHVRAIRPL